MKSLLMSVSPLLRTIVSCSILLLVLQQFAVYLPLPGQASRKLSEMRQEIASADEEKLQASTAEILARPIFHQNRRPAAEKEAVQEQKVMPRRIDAPFALVGVVGNTDAGRTAYLQHTVTRETHSVREGDQVGEWIIIKIEPLSVTLEANERRQILDMSGGG